MYLNIELLKKLLLIDHPSKGENEMMSFILNYIRNIDNITVYLDYYGNLFITKNTTNPDLYPCLIAHTDCVVEFNSARNLSIDNNAIRSYYIHTGEQTVLGADDCVGICCALQMLYEFDDLKVIFTVEEEIGGNGADAAIYNINFFTDISFLIQVDRRGKSDLITHTNGYDITSEEFLKDIEGIMDQYGYSKNTGTFTDVGTLSHNMLISGVNVSCGYYNEHTRNEYCILPEVEDCFNFVYDIISNLKDNHKQYPTPEQPKEREYSNIDFSYPKEDYQYSDIPDLYKDYSPKYSISEDPDFTACESCPTMDCMNCEVYKNIY